ncbi:MAG: ATP-binding protein [Candidatus Eremiobacteraeota bacterium]|nr:ATP-binding protein [Candidatus Eremiobacteraeota bacterium]
MDPGAKVEERGEKAAHQPSVLVSIAPEPHSSAVIRQRVADFGRRYGVAPDDLREFLALLGEAVANAIKHSQSTSPIEVRCTVEGDCIVGSVRDRGIGFTAHSANRFELPSLVAEGGRGLPIMRYCSDTFVLESAPGAGTSVTVGRRFRCFGRGGATRPQDSAAV